MCWLSWLRVRRLSRRTFFSRTEAVTGQGVPAPDQSKPGLILANINANSQELSATRQGCAIQASGT
jgi:hypothetical protein